MRRVVMASFMLIGYFNSFNGENTVRFAAFRIHRLQTTAETTWKALLRTIIALAVLEAVSSEISMLYVAYVNPTHTHESGQPARGRGGVVTKHFLLSHFGKESGTLFSGFVSPETFLSLLPLLLFHVL
jgi:hypothetical protein